jgi:hypothetical protein
LAIRLVRKEAKKGGKMTKKLWEGNECAHCGAVTDLDETCCSACRRNHLNKKLFDKNQIEKLIRERKLYSKYPTRIAALIKSPS